MHARRSELTCPGHSMSMMAKAAASVADVVIFDLEDACAASQKVAARQTVAEALKTLSFAGDKLKAYRVNGVETAFCYRDIVEIVESAGQFIDVLVVPKVRSADEVRFVDTLLRGIERARGLPVGKIRLEILIETAAGLLNAQSIAQASPRVASLIFGVADFAGELGARDFRGPQAPQHFLYARSHLLAAARAAGVDAIDSVTVQYKDLGQVEADASAASAMGFDGKWAIHPAQVPIINRCFTPSAEEVARAKRIVEAYQRADTEAGQGAIVIDDEMVDAATVVVEQKRLARSR